MVDVEFRVPIYGTKIKVVVNADIDKYAKDNDIDDRGINHRAVVYDFFEYDRTFDLIVLFGINVKSNDIVHEVFHLVCYIMKHIGCKLSDESEEAFAYLNEYLYKKITSLIIIEKQKLKVEE